MTRRKLERIRRKYNRERREYIGFFGRNMPLSRWSLEYWRECKHVTTLLRKAPDNWWIEPKP